MKIVAPDGFPYEYNIDKEKETIQIMGAHWKDLVYHYGLYYLENIEVDLQGSPEFFRATIRDQNNKENKLLVQPGYLYPLSANFTYIPAVMYAYIYSTNIVMYDMQMNKSTCFVSVSHAR